MERFVNFKKKDEDKQLAYGEVYVPNVPDTDDEYMIPDEIEKMAHKFLRTGLVDQIDTKHNFELNGSEVVESFIVRKGDPDFIEGSWVLAVRVDDQLWPLVKSGELAGFSMAGKGGKSCKRNCCRNT